MQAVAGAIIKLTVFPNDCLILGTCPMTVLPVLNLHADACCHEAGGIHKVHMHYN